MDSSEACVPLEMEMEMDDHPPYAEMIYRAIEALREKDGSTKNAIDNYILQNYGDRLRHTHPTLLTRHLDHLTSAGLLLLINNNSYNLPSALPYPPQPTTAARSPTPTILVGPTQPVTTTDLPPNPNGLKRRRPGRPPKTQNATASPPTRTVAVLGKPKNPVGRPKGSKSAANRGGQIKVGDLVRRLEYFQSKVKESLDVLKPYFNHESPVTAIAAIKELEALANLDLKTPSTQHQQQFPHIPLYPSASTSST